MAMRGMRATPNEGRRPGAGAMGAGADAGGGAAVFGVVGFSSAIGSLLMTSSGAEGAASQKLPAGDHPPAPGENVGHSEVFVEDDEVGVPPGFDMPLLPELIEVRGVGREDADGCLDRQ